MISKKNIKKICPPIIWNWLSSQIKNREQEKKNMILEDGGTAKI